jgi:hypothetical protein
MASKHWIGSTTGNFSDNTRWSLTSGGPNNTTHPVAGDDIYFDSGGTGECDIDINIGAFGTPGAASMNIGTGATVVQDTGAFGAVNLSGAVTQTGGTWTGGNEKFWCASFSQSGGTFNSTSNQIFVSGNFSLTGGIYNNGSAELDVSGTFVIGASGTFTLHPDAYFQQPPTTNNGTIVYNGDGNYSGYDLPFGYSYANLSFNSAAGTGIFKSNSPIAYTGTFSVVSGTFNNGGTIASAGTTGSPYSYQITAVGSEGPPYTYAASPLPAGLHVNASTGLITGSPSGPGVTNTVISVIGTGTLNQTLQITVTGSLAGGAFLLNFLNKQ